MHATSNYCWHEDIVPESVSVSDCLSDTGKVIQEDMNDRTDPQNSDNTSKSHNTRNTRNRVIGNNSGGGDVWKGVLVRIKTVKGEYCFGEGMYYENVYVHMLMITVYSMYSDIVCSVYSY